ncbi:MAG: Sensory box transcriptional regulator, LuxR family [Rhodanobacteraceae bacterium]|jgi:PAS domain S-box-containing protein|nr:MAG: Sensory box transcriptional regulator, LuxR family [Rhodanobacteraceae bacterium]
MNPPLTRTPVDRRQLQQIIAGLTDGVMLLDPDRSIVWVNEAAIAVHGCIRAEELGANATQYRKRFSLKYRNNHRLTAKQYPIERVLAGETFSDVLVEVARKGDADFHSTQQVRGMALTNANGEVESLALVIKDVTERFSAEERFERTFAANPAPAVICRLRDLRYIKTNPGFLTMTGYERDQVIDRRFRELDVLDHAENREEAIRSLRGWLTIPQQEAVIRQADGKQKFVIVAGQPIEVGDEQCMLFTFIDLEARKRAEMSLRESEERFSKAFRLAPVPMIVFALRDMRALTINDAFTAITGYAIADLQGRTVEDIGLSGDVAAMRALVARLNRREDIRNEELPVRTREGAIIDCLLSADTVMIQGEPCVLCVIQDITERKRSEMDLVSAIEAVMKDTSWFSHTVMEKLAQLRRPDGSGAKAELATLTPREKDVLGLICKGLSDAEIAAALKLSRNTVRNHVATLYGKIGVNRRSAAVVWGRERGMVSY